MHRQTIHIKLIFAEKAHCEFRKIHNGKLHNE